MEEKKRWTMELRKRSGRKHGRREALKKDRENV